ncbi:MAG TPA: GLUG motif-containing protein [Rhizomicrobium sp.]|nr:GLUG motif-containing protein [Rhizomicrobium sp.]
MQSREGVRQTSAVLTAGLFVLVAPTAQAAVVISSDATQDMSCSNGVCAPTASDAVLNVADLESLLGSGSVEVTSTGSGGVQANDVNVEAALSWSNQNLLYIVALNWIGIDKKIALAGQGGLSLATGADGALSFGTKGSVTFADLSSALTINGIAYTLVNNITTLASDIASNPAGSYALANSYDASKDGTYSNSPIATELTGTVHGLGNTLSNLSVNHSKGKVSVGLFEYVAKTGSVDSLRLQKLTIISRNGQFGVGGLVGSNDGLLFGDTVDGSISSKGGNAGTVGGVVGGNGGTVTSSSADVDLKGPGTAMQGGLAGLNEGTINFSHATGNVESFLAGGLVGINTGDIDQSYATGSIAGGWPGGLAGSSGGTITNSYSTGTAGGKTESDAGLISDDEGATVTSSYSAGAVKTGGGFVCQHIDEPVFTNDYWDTTTSGQVNGACHGNVGGVTGVTSKQLKSGLPSGFDPSIWAEDKKINNGFPYLINNPPAK